MDVVFLCLCLAKEGSGGLNAMVVLSSTAPGLRAEGLRGCPGGCHLHQAECALIIMYALVTQFRVQLGQGWC